MSFKKTIILILALILVGGATIFVAAEIINKNENNDNASAYGSYYDNAKNKVLEKTIAINESSKTLKYVRTENIKDAAVDKRSDSYGTYDVYVDNQKTEYLYLLNTNLFCGIKDENVGQATPQSDAIAEANAKDIAFKFLKSFSSTASSYKFLSCVYDELAGIYDIQYYMPISGYKTDDICRIWVNAKGEIKAFSAFNNERYKNITVSENAVKNAQNKISNKITATKGTSEYEIVDSYITINDDGKLALVQLVDYLVPSGEVYITQRDSITQVI